MTLDPIPALSHRVVGLPGRSGAEPRVALQASQARAAHFVGDTNETIVRGPGWSAFVEGSTPVIDAAVADALLESSVEVLARTESPQTDEPSFVLRFVYVGDSHSDYSNAARAATVIKRAQKQFSDLIIVHSGDALVGTPLINVGGQGKAEMDILEEMGIHIYVPGNHDLDYGAPVLARCLEESPDMDVLVANWSVTGALAKRFAPYSIREVNGRRVAIIGLSADPAAYGNDLEEITYRDPVEVLRELLPVLRETERPDAIVVASHLGLTHDDDLAGRFPEVNAWIGGHSHSVLTEPESHTHPDDSVNYVVHAGKNFNYVGFLKLGIKDARAVSASGGLLGIEKRDVPADPKVSAILGIYREQLAGYQRVVATAVRPIPRRAREGVDSHLGNLVADFIRERVTRDVGEVDVGFINKTGLRTDIPAGPITVETLHKLFPFESNLCVTELSGRQIQQMLDHTAGTWGGNPISGVSYTIDRGRATEIMINGAPLDPERTYRFASVDYLIEDGGDGYAVCAQGENAINTGINLRDALTEYLGERREIDVGDVPEQRTRKLEADLDTTIGKMLE